MVSYSSVLKQLSDLGLKFRFLAKPEVRELAHILNQDESIRHCVFGFYQGGSALLVATNMRLLLIDKRTFFLNLEDLRYEMINEVDFAGGFIDAAVKLYTSSKELRFRSFADVRLRKLCSYVQDQITRARQLEHMVEQVKPAGHEWRPYTLLLRNRLGKFVTGYSIEH